MLFRSTNLRALRVMLFAGLVGLTGLHAASAGPESRDAKTEIAQCVATAEHGTRARESCIGATTSSCLATAITTVDMLECLAPEIEAWGTAPCRYL